MNLKKRLAMFEPVQITGAIITFGVSLVVVVAPVLPELLL
jgi:hypothetical protein